MRLQRVLPFNKGDGLEPGHHSRHRAAPVWHRSGDRPFCYGVYVIVITWLVGFHWTSSASVSATNRRGRSVLPALMMGITLALLSMVTDLPFTLATSLLIHSSTVVPFRTMVAFCVDAFQVIVPPVASTTARMGSRVRELRMMGAASREAGFPSTSIVLLPIFS